MSLPRIGNRTARRLFLDRHGLIAPPHGAAKGAGLAEVIGTLGFVQVDSINTVARAHDMILYARRQSYRPGGWAPLVARHRTHFEHWTHDAAVIPAAYFPHWKLRFARDRARLRERWAKWREPGYEAKFDAVLDRIANHGPCCSADVGEDEERSNGGWWEWHPSKTALEYLWRTGALSVARREGFRKIYDLTERVFPDQHRAPQPEVAETVDWACRAALDRLGFATSGELAAFWDLVAPAEAKAWCAEALARGDIAEVDVEMAGGRLRRHFVWPETVEAGAPEPSQRVRILSPFDPLLRDRKRAERLFGFHYRIEVFVPEPKRRYGYYVFPVLEGDRMIGRIDMKADRSAGVLNVRAFWPEAGARMGAGRRARLEAELERVARMAGCENVAIAADWMRAA